MSTNTRRRPPQTATTAAARPKIWGWLAFALPIAAIAILVVVGQGDPEDTAPDDAPPFALPDTLGRTVTLEDILAGGDALLYFSMGVGCDGCFAQIPEAHDGLLAAGVQLVPVMVDPAAAVASEALRFGITTPVLIDASREVSSAYGMLGVYGHTDRPSHSFALVRRDGTVASIKHYATMFVPLQQLLDDLGI